MAALLPTPAVIKTSIQNREISSAANSVASLFAQNRCRYFCGLSMKQCIHNSSNGGIYSRKQRSQWQTLAAPQSSVGGDGPNLVMENKLEGLRDQHSYLFRTEIGGLVKVRVEAGKLKHNLVIEVSALPWNGDHDLVLRWGMFRSDYLQFASQASLKPKAGGGKNEIKMSPMQKDLDKRIVKLEFDSAKAPFFFSFLLFSSLDGSAIRSHRKTEFCVPVGIGRGCPTPLGASFSSDGTVNFSLFSKNAETVVLCLYSDMGKEEPTLEIALDPYVNRTGHIWHVSMANCQNYAGYGYRCNGNILWDSGSRFHMRYVLLDPYAKIIGRFKPDCGDTVSLAKCIGLLQKEPLFDWAGDTNPQLLMEKLVVYRLNVGLFTKGISCQLSESSAGTFAGVTEKIQHFKNLGINAVLLEPIFSFDEQKGPYFPYHFFSPMNIYGSGRDGRSAIISCKDMVKALHANGIEVLLEVVFTQTAEGGDTTSQMVTLRGIDHSSYYIIDQNISPGVSNALNCNNPIVQKIILDSLRFWVTEFHVDGFCFVNASSLLLGTNGQHLSHPPLVEAIAFDPLLSKTKLIADSSVFDMSSGELRFPHWKRWAEMNFRFCTDVRKFLRGEGLLSDLATRLCGSGDIFSDSRGPAFSFNFVARNSGLSLVDLVSYSNEDLCSELSWNCGKEGPTGDSSVLEVRLRQIRNFLFILFISLGVPVLNMGDECGLSTGGALANENRRPFDWTCLETEYGAQFTEFIAYLSSFRSRRSDLLQTGKFLKVENIEWQGNDQSPPQWQDPSCKFLGMLLKAEKKGEVQVSGHGHLFVAFNASDLPLTANLPELPAEFVWCRLIDTALPFPGFFLCGADPNIQQYVGLTCYELQPHTCALFEAEMQSNLN